MATSLAVKPAEHTDQPALRPQLDDLVALGSDLITAQLYRALPGTESGQVAVAAFNSSI
ncbi:hypothetical protein GCM10009665_07970 [Kitasatospora nipponensis]|uniref:FXSXX-COOH protein n=1 Tax=Kitasatospora nipponensis TaxID=258049 RepID=A0ABP4GH50_9ACTN